MKQKKVCKKIELDAITEFEHLEQKVIITTIIDWLIQYRPTSKIRSRCFSSGIQRCRVDDDDERLGLNISGARKAGKVS